MAVESEWKGGLRVWRATEAGPSRRTSAPVKARRLELADARGGGRERVGLVVGGERERVDEEADDEHGVARK